MPSLEPLVEAWYQGRGHPPSCQAPGGWPLTTPFPPIKKWLFLAWTWKSREISLKKRCCWLLKIIMFFVCVFHFMGWIFFPRSNPCFVFGAMFWTFKDVIEQPPQEKKTSYNESPIRKSRCDRKTISTIHCSSAIYFSNNIPGTFLKRQNLLTKSCASSRPKKTYTTHSCLSPPSFGSPC